MNTNGRFVDRIREISDKVIAPGAEEHDQAGDWPEASIKALAGAGLLGLTLPEELGGMGKGPSDYVAAVEEIAAACASTAMIFVMHVCASQTIKQSSLPQRDSLLSDIAAGKHLSTLAFSEKGSEVIFGRPSVKRANRMVFTFSTARSLTLPAPDTRTATSCPLAPSVRLA